MGKKSDVSQIQISTSAVSLAMMVCSALWLASVGACYAACGFKNDWSATPLVWMLMLIVMPTICFCGWIILADANRRSRLSQLNWWALGVSFFPVTIGTGLTVWAVKALLAMCGVGH